MKYGKIIKPEDFDALYKSGELRFGMELEFSNSDKFDPKYAVIQKDRFTGFSIRFARRSCNFESEKYGDWGYARFLLPDLRKNDPIICGYPQQEPMAEQRHFIEFDSEISNAVWVYSHGRCSWAGVDKKYEIFTNWRLPTKKELKEAGMENWYDGRIELEDK